MTRLLPGAHLPGRAIGRALRDRGRDIAAPGGLSNPYRAGVAVGCRGLHPRHCRPSDTVETTHAVLCGSPLLPAQVRCDQDVGSLWCQAQERDEPRCRERRSRWRGKGNDAASTRLAVAAPRLPTGGERRARESSLTQRLVSVGAPASSVIGETIGRVWDH